MIDLHSHTTNSDGTWSTKKLLTEAEKLGLEVFSITDHDTVKSHIEIEQNRELQSIFKGKLIKGVELNCTFDGVKIEILAYDFDLHPINEWLENYYTEENKRKMLIEEFNDLVNMCNSKNIKIEEDLQYNPDTQWPVDVIYYSIVKFEENKKFFTEEQWDDIRLFYRTCTVDKNFILYQDIISKQIPSLEFFSKFIHEHNGKIFLAHLYNYELGDHIAYLNKIFDKNLIDGVEVYHSSFTDEQTKTLEEYCKQKRVLMSGGSDCHGERRVERRLGVGFGNLNIKKEIIKDWNI